MRELTIVITTKNHFELTRVCLESIFCTLPRDTYDVILVDNGSTDQTASFSNHVTFIQNAAGGLYRSWNIGIEAAQTPFVAVLNNDLFFCTPDWWQRLAATFQATGAGWLFPRTVETQALARDTYDLVADALHNDGICFEPTPGRIEACCFAIPRTVYEQVGPFDTRFSIWYGEKDYEIRMVRQRISYGRVCNAVVRHFGSSTLGLAPEGPEELQLNTGEKSVFKRLALADYSAFRAKYSDADLEPLGLRVPQFGPLALGRD